MGAGQVKKFELAKVLHWRRPGSGLFLVGLLEARIVPSYKLLHLAKK